MNSKTCHPHSCAPPWKTKNPLFPYCLGVRLHFDPLLQQRTFLLTMIDGVQEENIAATAKCGFYCVIRRPRCSYIAASTAVIYGAEQCWKIYSSKQVKFLCVMSCGSKIILHVPKTEQKEFIGARAEERGSLMVLNLK